MTVARSGELLPSRKLPALYQTVPATPPTLTSTATTFLGSRRAGVESASSASDCWGLSATSWASLPARNEAELSRLDKGVIPFRRSQGIWEQAMPLLPPSPVRKISVRCRGVPSETIRQWSRKAHRVLVLITQLVSHPYRVGWRPRNVPTVMPSRRIEDSVLASGTSEDRGCLWESCLNLRWVDCRENDVDSCRMLMLLRLEDRTRDAESGKAAADRSKSQQERAGASAYCGHGNMWLATRRSVLLAVPAVDAQEDSQCEDVSMSINEDFATRVDCVREIEDMLPEPCKTRAYGDWMIWMVHRAWLDDPSLTDLNFGNMHMPPPHIERRIAPKLMEAMARNTHLEKLTLSNSNLLKASGVQLANALRANSSLKTLNLESNWLDSNAVRELALAIKDNLSSKIECLRFSHQKQMGQFFGRPTEEAVGQMMQSNDTIVKLGFECDDAHWRNEIDRALLRNNDSWRRRQAPPDGEALPTAEERSLGRIHLVHPPDASANEVLNSYGTLCDYLDHNKKLPTTSQLQNSTRNSGQQITYAKAAPMIKELRSWMLDHSLNKLVEVLDTFETPTCGILRQWSSCHDHWIVEVWVEDRRCTFRSSREPPTSVSDDWVNWLRANSNTHTIGPPETRAGA
ncbi:TMOD2 [Symbiodinium sp. CCMP2456]|nr:TMOD2 [Symbiodinium sp. CCMP2456]